MEAAGERGLVAKPLHCRNGEGTGADGVCDGASGDRTLKRGSDDGDLCRTADMTARNGVCKIDEQLAHTRFLKECAEKNKQEDVR